jgi:hypothetical protein
MSLAKKFEIVVICSYADQDKLKLSLVPDRYAREGSTYLTTNPEDNMFDVNNRISELENRIKRLTWLTEHRLKGINYWKSKS